jgi:proline dehydrogenase
MDNQQSQPEFELSFEDTATAFAHQDDRALNKANFLFSVMGNATILKMGLILTPWAVKWRIPLVRTLLRQTLFQQFVGGETLEKTKPVVEKLNRFGVETILDYGAEGEGDEKGFDAATLQFIDVIEYAASQTSIPYISIKVTGIARFSLLEKLDAAMSDTLPLQESYKKACTQLNEAEGIEWKRVEERLNRICQHAQQKNIAVLVDAEETWIQDPVDALTMQMMAKYNQHSAIVYNTIQLYRHDRLAFLKQSAAVATETGFMLAVKLVRGAYMEKERARAIEKNYPSPIQPDKNATDRDYDSALKFCLQHQPTIATIVATHNEQSSKIAASLKKADSRLHFSQLYGMSDNITFNLAKQGYQVSKYLPFGPIEEVVPYLMRRAQENSSVSGQTSREWNLIQKERNRRKMNRG